LRQYRPPRRQKQVVDLRMEGFFVFDQLWPRIGIAWERPTGQGKDVRRAEEPQPDVDARDGKAPKGQQQ